MMSTSWCGKFTQYHKVSGDLRLGNLETKTCRLPFVGEELKYLYSKHKEDMDAAIASYDQEFIDRWLGSITPKPKAFNFDMLA